MPSLPNVPETLDDPVWQQQPNEAKSHYNWFQFFLALKPFERNYQNAWNAINVGGTKENTHYSQYFGVVARHWRWKERAALFDIHNAQIGQARWIERDKERRESAYEVGEKLVNQAKRVLNKIEQLPDDQLKASLSEAKDIALAGTQLQEAAIPSMQLAVDQMQWVLSALSPDKRAMVLEKLREAKTGSQGLLSSNNTASNDTIEAEYDVIDYADEETATE